MLYTGSASESAVAGLLGVATLDSAHELESANRKASELQPESEPEPEVQPENVVGGSVGPIGGNLRSDGEPKGTGLNERPLPDTCSLGAVRTLQS